MGPAYFAMGMPFVVLNMVYVLMFTTKKFFVVAIQLISGIGFGLVAL